MQNERGGKKIQEPSTKILCFVFFLKKQKNKTKNDEEESESENVT